LTAAYPLHIHVRPFFEEHDIKLVPALTDRGSEFCGNPERHGYECISRSRTLITPAFSDFWRS
jgi:hypothetical protein